MITNALGSRSVNLREMMRRATAAVRSSGKGTVFINFCFFSAVIRHMKNNFVQKFICLSAEYANSLVQQYEYVA